MEEAMFLTKFARKVFIVHRRDKLRASKIMQDRAFKNKKNSFIWDTVPVKVLGEKEVSGVVLKNVKTGKEEKLDVQGFFLAIGHTPNTDVFKNHIELHDNGYIKVSNQTKTSVTGVFAAGDVQDHRYRQAVTAAGSGCAAAIDAEKYLESLL